MEMAALQRAGFQPVQHRQQVELDGGCQPMGQVLNEDRFVQYQHQIPQPAIITPILVIETTHIILPGNAGFPVFPSMGTSGIPFALPWPNTGPYDASRHPLCPCCNQEFKCFSSSVNGNGSGAVTTFLPVPNAYGQYAPTEGSESRNLMLTAAPPTFQNLMNYQPDTMSGVGQPRIVYYGSANDE